jgi:uncharacterized protein
VKEKRDGTRIKTQLRMLRPGPSTDVGAREDLYECTFCSDCVEDVLFNVCPNCGGGFAPRPIRPATEWRPGLSIAKRPASNKRVHLSYSADEIAAHSNRIKSIPPEVLVAEVGAVTRPFNVGFVFRHGDIRRVGDRSFFQPDRQNVAFCVCLMSIMGIVTFAEYKRFRGRFGSIGAGVSRRVRATRTAANWPY